MVEAKAPIQSEIEPALCLRRTGGDMAQPQQSRYRAAGATRYGDFFVEADNDWTELDRKTSDFFILKRAQTLRGRRRMSFSLASERNTADTGGDTEGDCYADWGGGEATLNAIVAKLEQDQSRSIFVSRPAHGHTSASARIAEGERIALNHPVFRIVPYQDGARGDDRQQRGMALPRFGPKLLSHRLGRPAANRITLSA
jgi:hypothetical protein